jgi:hypothetical protein
VSSHRHHLVDRGFSPQTFSPAPTNVHHSFPAVTSALANDNAANATVIGHNCSPPPLLASTAAAAPASMAVPTVAPSTTVASPPIAWRRKLVLVLVGLPARGKSYISYKLLGYLRWRGLHANLFNVGRHRRNVAEQHDTKQSSDFFSPENTNAKQQRDEIAMEVLECMLDWLGQGGDVSIFDATNCFDSADHELFTSIGWLSLDGVLSHFSKNATLDVGCYVDGELVFKPITRSDVTIAEGKFQFVRFESQSAKNGANQAVSLVVTDNHRMYGRLGAATYAKSSGQYFWPKKGTVEEPPPYAVHQASAVLKGATEHAHANFQLQSMFELGKVAESNLLPFAEPLGLTTTDHIDAFLWLYGYWCGDGWLDNKQAVCFGPRKKKDMATLDAVFGRLPLLKLESGGTGKDGYWRAENLSKGQRYYFIYAPAWWELFAGQYGHKYSGEAAKAAATADAEDINSAKWFWWWVFKRLERDQLRSVLSGLRFADGAEAEASESGGHIFTSSERFRDEIERVCVTAGYSTHVYMRFEEGSTHGVNEQGVTFVCRTRAWAVHYSTETRSAQVRLVVGKEVQAEPEARQAKVWCVSVPTTQQLIMVRRVVKRDDDGEPIEWSRGVVVGNTTAARRQLVLSRCQARSIDLRVIFLESICDDARVLESNYRVKVANSPDYKGMSQEDALKDLRERVRNYERVYESIQDDELSYIKLHNLASKVICNRIHGQLSHSIAAYLMSIHIGRRPIFFVRAGHSESERTSDKQQQTKSEAIGSAATTAAAPSTSSTSEPAGGGVEGGKDDLPSQQFQDRQILKLPEDLTTAAAVAKASAHPSISSGTGGQEYNIPYTVAMAANLDKHGKKFASRLAHFITHKVEEYTAQKEMQDRELAASYAGKEKELEASYEATQGATGSPPRANLAITVPAGSTASSSVAASTTSPPTASDTHLPLVVYTSTLPRAIQTASLLQDRAYICEHQSSLNMVDTGVCSGLTIEEIKEKMPWELQKWAKHKYKVSARETVLEWMYAVSV